MLFIIQFFQACLKSLVVSVWGIFTLYLVGRNNKLSKQNDSLNKDITEQSKNIDVKKEVINALREIKDLDINGNVERMRMYNKKSKSKNRTL
jgi:predicted RNase H-like nuclease (RuvC/YqgF family)